MSKASEKLENVSKRVFELRNRLGYTQEALAAKLGVSRNYVYMVEKGRTPGKKFVEKLRELEQPSESTKTNPNVIHEESPAYGGANDADIAERLRMDALTLRVMANRLDAEAKEIEQRHGKH